VVFNYSIYQIERNEKQVITFATPNNGYYCYEDGYVSIMINVEKDIVHKREFLTTIKNNTSSTIDILWDRAAIIFPDSSIGSVIHGGVKFIDKENSQKNTIIPRKSKLEDVIVPATNIYYSGGQYGTGWNTKRLITEYCSTKKEFEAIKEKYKDAYLQVLIPVKVLDEIIEYYFIFSVIPLESSSIYY
jgi:hypothetical protein